MVEGRGQGLGVLGHVHQAGLQDGGESSAASDQEDTGQRPEAAHGEGVEG